ncbi:hypothetical protein [Nostoc sp. PCC 7524]|uniref:hypothetical protein n=1 Tax=Nostoc sp. (strain ATCC 29411 / PCC 7524) TaxID=28072 RepID=UPI000B28C7BA|nr:hypothetical protein [Nostoc sp. PCC 7524]
MLLLRWRKPTRRVGDEGDEGDEGDVACFSYDGVSLPVGWQTRKKLSPIPSPQSPIPSPQSPVH